MDSTHSLECFLFCSDVERIDVQNGQYCCIKYAEQHMDTNYIFAIGLGAIIFLCGVHYAFSIKFILKYEEEKTTLLRLRSFGQVFGKVFVALSAEFIFSIVVATPQDLSSVPN